MTKKKKPPIDPLARLEKAVEQSFEHGYNKTIFAAPIRDEVLPALRKERLRSKRMERKLDHLLVILKDYNCRKMNAYHGAPKPDILADLTAEELREQAKFNRTRAQWHRGEAAGWGGKEPGPGHRKAQARYLEIAERFEQAAKERGK